jgi:arginase
MNALDKPRIILVGVPYDENSSFLRGAAAAPSSIRQALYSDAYNLWSESGVNLGEENVLKDGGDIIVGSSDDSSETGRRAALDEIEKMVSLLIADQQRVIILGGDHAITFPLVRAHRQFFEHLSILHFDAHPDLYDEFQGSRYSHACPFARIMEEGLVERLVQVGIRTMTGHQRQQALKFGVEVIEMSTWQDDLQLDFDTPLYISLDMDVLDPAYAPGISHWEPGGLSPRQVINLIQSLQAPVVGADIVEYNPQRDPQKITAVIAAKFVKEIAGKMIA